ncbi:hypothetical protein [Pedobacter steynii]
MCILSPSTPPSLILLPAARTRSIKLWGANDFKLYKILSLEKNTEGHFHSINKLIWSSDGKYLISTGDDRQIMIWEFNS